ncbi:sigma factor [Fimbriiglobus ruber]|uniref:sigma factor n=1 Tax=Fimbriiglobus ruber TaxID=1908690 RepID=UPI00117A8059|nr:sigma factor [Fimbriiglobus ruber]
MPQPEFPPAVRAMIRSFAAKVAGYGVAAAHDREDAAQELAVALIRRWDRFDPARGPAEPFAATVLYRTAAELHRKQTAAKRDRGRVTDGVDLDRIPDLSSWRGDVADVATVLAAVSDDMRDLAAVLAATGSKAAAARALGISPSTLRRRVARLRARFEDHGFGNF